MIEVILWKAVPLEVAPLETGLSYWNDALTARALKIPERRPVQQDGKGSKLLGG